MRLHHQYQCYLAQVLLGKKKKICFSHSKMTLISLQLVWILMGVKWAAYRICQNISFTQVREASHIQSQLLPCSTRPYFSTLTVRRRREASWLSKLTSDFFPLQQWEDNSDIKIKPSGPPQPNMGTWISTNQVQPPLLDLSVSIAISIHQSLFIPFSFQKPKDHLKYCLPSVSSVCQTLDVKV